MAWHDRPMNVLPAFGFALLLSGPLLLNGGLALGAAGPEPVSSGSAGADDLLIVDCLLPGQVRQLGRRSVYMSARQPVRTSARDCGIRGGEYVRSDRADYRSALSVWLEAARDGDSEAQVNVGTIFEKGLGRAPDPATAAHWYTLAAESGHIEAQLKLGHLYEVGLGVERDPERSLHWYRRAMGLEDAALDLLPPPSSRAPEQALKKLAAELDTLRSDNQELRDLLEQARAGSTSEQAAGADRVAMLQAELARRTEEMDALEQRYQSARGQYLAALDERDAARLQLDELREQHTAVARELAEAAQLPEALARKEAALGARRQRVAELESRLGELEAHLQAAAAQSEATRQAAAQRLLAGPSLTLIDPQVPATRGLVQVTLPATGRQQIIGRVDAPGGLLALRVNDQPLEPNESGVFLTEVTVRGTTTVRVTAVDRQGKREDLSFELRSIAGAAGTAPAPAAAPPGYPGIDFGRYHALVIGNNGYRHMPRLRTAIHDAEVMSRLLRERYGFEVTLLRDADRYAILSALNDLRERLTPDDNLLIYYAGHGELDEVNMRGHWLPVDAELDNTANWISNVAVTDILNVMRARHVMLVVDSCYSGSLTRSSTTRVATPMSAAEEENWLRTMVRKRGRLVLSSGGLAPVLDAGGGGHSVFARALIEVLANNQGLLDGRGLYQEVAARVAYAASSIQFDQVPEFGPIRHAGHEAGAFFLVPTSGVQ